MKSSALPSPTQLHTMLSTENVHKLPFSRFLACEKNFMDGSDDG
ncbi:Hypothetical protein HEAR2494 [Herminiimonas arsenicoxydans]|uniref:Uncharacterized protein n=1 Tax=Herminiimonas arsenicoxydans TaxID=204773 RepID=A4G7Y4_HERAR|nr:Hypothetical protein HEAR2494 [Herminiimonas arsenicoxydans]